MLGNMILWKEIPTFYIIYIDIIKEFVIIEDNNCNDHYNIDRDREVQSFLCLFAINTDNYQYFYKTINL